MLQNYGTSYAKDLLNKYSRYVIMKIWALDK